MAGEHLTGLKRQNALAWAGQAENPPKPRRGIRLDREMSCSVVTERSSREVLFLICDGLLCFLNCFGSAAQRTGALPNNPFLEGCPGLDAPRRKRASKPCG